MMDDEEFDRQLAMQKDRLDKFENSGNIPSTADWTKYPHTKIKFNLQDIINWLKGWFK